MKLEVLHVPDCPKLAPLLDRLRQVTDLPVITYEIDTDDEAAAQGMTGSPTLLIDGVDPFATPELDTGVSCRIYRDEDGRMIPAPSAAQLRDAICSAGPAAVLSTWRTRALPLDPVERAVHQAILRTFAATSQPPALDVLDQVTAGSGTTTSAVLQSLHDGDAIRLDPVGQIVVAYPFSATPHRAPGPDRRPGRRLRDVRNRCPGHGGDARRGH